MEIPLPVPAVVVSKLRAINYELTCSQSSSLVAQSSVEKKKLTWKIPLPVPVSGCEQAQGHEL
jgi:hypothetical protein